MAAKKTVKTSQKAKNARVKGDKKTKKTDVNERQRWIEGLIIILIGVYCYYAFVTAQPTIIDRFIGKYILMYLFGNAVPILCLIAIASGILVMTDKFNQYKETISYLILLTGNFMVLLSAFIPNLTTNYKVIDLFDLAAYGGYGGIVGTLVAYLLNTFLSTIGTVLILFILSIVEIALLIKANFPNLYSRVITSDFGITALKNKYYDLKEDINQKKEILEKRKEKELTEGATRF